MSGILTYTVGGSIRNRSADKRGRSAVKNWRFAYVETEAPETETGRSAETGSAETARGYRVTGFNTL